MHEHSARIADLAARLCPEPLSEEVTWMLGATTPAQLERALSQWQEVNHAGTYECSDLQCDLETVVSLAAQEDPQTAWSILVEALRSHQLHEHLPAALAVAPVRAQATRAALTDPELMGLSPGLWSGAWSTLAKLDRRVDVDAYPSWLAASLAALYHGEARLRPTELAELAQHVLSDEQAEVFRTLVREGSGLQLALGVAQLA